MEAQPTWKIDPIQGEARETVLRIKEKVQELNNLLETSKKLNLISNITIDRDVPCGSGLLVDTIGVKFTIEV